MEYRIKRTSLWGNEHQPHPKAYPKKYLRVDERTVASPDDLRDGWCKKDWFARGINHRIENGHICRDFEEDGWFIEIENLNYFLMTLKSEFNVDEIVLSSDYGHLCVEIYDAYRE